MRPTQAPSVTFAVPGDLATPTGGYGYARWVIAALRARKWQVGVIDLGEGFPRVAADQRAVARERLLGTPPGAPIIVDGLALGALPDEARDATRSHCLIGLVHHPLALETGLSPAMADAFRAPRSGRLPPRDTSSPPITRPRRHLRQTTRFLPRGSPLRFRARSGSSSRTAATMACPRFWRSAPSCRARATICW